MTSATKAASAAQNLRLQTLIAAAQSAMAEGNTVSKKTHEPIEALRKDDVLKLVGLAKDQGITADEFVKTLAAPEFKLTGPARDLLESAELLAQLPKDDAFEAPSVREAAKAAASNVANDLRPTIQRIFAAAFESGDADVRSPEGVAKLQSAIEDATRVFSSKETYTDALKHAKPILEVAAKIAGDRVGDKLGIRIPMAPDPDGAASAGHELGDTPALDFFQKALSGLRQGGVAGATAELAKFLESAAKTADESSPVGAALLRASPQLSRFLPFIGNAHSIRAVSVATKDLVQAAKEGTVAERWASALFFVGTVVGCVPGWQAVGAFSAAGKKLWNEHGQAAQPPLPGVENWV